MEYQKHVEKIIEQMNRVIIGKTEKIEYVVLALLASGHVLLEDVPGVGKTVLANTLARTVDLRFGRIQFTPDTLPSDVVGVSIYNPKLGEFQYCEGAIMHNIVLADEINRTSPKTQASLLEAMEERQVSIDGRIHKIAPPFMVIATQNPVDFLGTYNLPEAQLDRFMLRLQMGYPSEEDELIMALNYLGKPKLPFSPNVVDQETILHMQEEVKQVKIHNDLIHYVIEIINGTRQHEQISLGASPRATLAVLSAARSRAYMKGRTYCIPDDILEVLEVTLCHRMMLSMEAKMNKVKAVDLLNSIIRKKKVPIIKEK